MNGEMVKNRKELIEHFSAVLQGYYSEFVEEERTRNGWLKTQLLELDVHESQDAEHIETLFRDFAQNDGNFTFTKLDDELFYCLKPTGDLTECIYIDAIDERFIVLYSALRSEPFDNVIDALTKKHDVDRAWFPQSFMSSLDGLGVFKGYGGRFNNEFFLEAPNQRLDDNPKFRHLSFKSWGHTKRLLTLIQGDPELKDEFSLTNMRIKVADDVNDDTDTAIDDITYAGRITSIGRSFRAHYGATMKIKDAYRNLVVDTIEKGYSITYRDHSIEGERIVFLFTKPIEDLADFSGRLFSGKKPFRLWGLEVVKKEHFIRVEVVDLHVKDRFLVEVYPNRVAMVITEGVCGNTVLRLLTLLQQSINSGVQLLSPSGEVISLEVSVDG